ncbi:2-isopropylmalate synthase (Alpha-isopropylmalate synthase) (Alpha-IPM synthetase) [Stygiomarasmius scandens]|uniref:2-isopropylmalate synthase n=1 Tax=Marasmiellus scandens TaxID=2682957 RepID=A0ABR1IYG8_9AGAR
MLSLPSQKYQHYTPLNLQDRKWPSNTVTNCPVWLSTDLRDGNQALSVPMTIQQKIELFHLLAKIGFREIEVGFPSASDTEFGFVRRLIETNIIPDSVWIQVMMPARKANILRTFEAIQGAKKVMLQLYSSTAPLFRDVIYKISKEDVIKLAVEHTHLVRLIANKYALKYGTEFRLVYGIEGFTQSELDFVIQVCSEVKDAWESHGDDMRPIIFNLAATVECAPANHFADQVEYFDQKFPDRNQIILSIHVHNDRGTAVSATELALLAGAERVEGCLFGNGERTGNVDLITLALNLYSQGISPGLDLSNLNELVTFMTNCTGIPVHPRHPYAGELVYTAFSGGHQDGIKKGLHHRSRNLTIGISNACVWTVPYLPVDPSDFGRAYEVRINSQSGKGGAAHVIEQFYGLLMPAEMQAEFSQVIQQICDSEARELDAAEICFHFSEMFSFQDKLSGRILSQKLLSLQNFQIQDTNAQSISGAVVFGTQQISFCLDLLDKNPAEVFLSWIMKKIAVDLTFSDEEVQISNEGAISFVKLRSRKVDQQVYHFWGVGKAKYRQKAAVRGAVSAVNHYFNHSML